MMFSILPLNIGHAFCFICLPNLTDVVTSDDRTTEATRERVFVFVSVVVPPTKGLELLRCVVEVYFFFFLRRVHLVYCNGLGRNQLRRNVLPCSHDLYFCSWWYVYCIGPSETCDSHHVLNEVPHRLKFISTFTLCDCLRAESNVVNGYASVAVARY